MSGHSKWHQIRHKKGALDAKRGKIFTQHARVITIAAKKGGDADMNPALRLAIDKAKAANMPNENIQRAVKKGTGELKDGAEITEAVYEGFGPGGVALLVHVTTDNKNRTVSAVRTIFTKHGGNMGGQGTTAWMFEQCGVIVVELGERDADETQLLAIEAGAQDVQQHGMTLTVYTAPYELNLMKEKLLKAGLTVTSFELQHIGKETIKISDEGTAKKILHLLEALDEDEDVSSVASNFDIAEELMEKLA